MNSCGLSGVFGGKLPQNVAQLSQVCRNFVKSGRTQSSARGRDPDGVRMLARMRACPHRRAHALSARRADQRTKKPRQGKSLPG
jgi:hypothetical protein